MSETRQINPAAVPNALRENTCAARNAHAATRPRRPLLTVAAILWVGVVLLSGSTLNQATAAEPTKTTVTSSTPQTSPIKVLWKREYGPTKIVVGGKEFRDLAIVYPKIIEINGGALLVVPITTEDRQLLESYLIKMDLSGNVSWQVSLGRVIAHAITEVSDGYLLVVGDKLSMTNDKLEYMNGKLTTLRRPTDIVKVDRQGKIQGRIENLAAIQVVELRPRDGLVELIFLDTVDMDTGKVCGIYKSLLSIAKDNFAVRERYKLFNLISPRPIAESEHVGLWCKVLQGPDNTWLLQTEIRQYSTNRADGGQFVRNVTLANSMGQRQWERTYIGRWYSPSDYSELGEFIFAAPEFIAPANSMRRLIPGQPDESNAISFGDLVGKMNKPSKHPKEFTVQKSWIQTINFEGRESKRTIRLIPGVKISILVQLQDGYLAVAYPEDEFSDQAKGNQPLLVKLNKEGAVLRYLTSPINMEYSDEKTLLVGSDNMVWLIGRGRTRAYAVAKIMFSE
jgi:hypothetical protein